ncbi:MAG: hypothetical protein AAFN59_04710 [Pseudomonadota bacterium]
MARKNKKPRTKATSATPKPVSRRSALGTFAAYGAGAVALVGGGTAFALDFRAKMREGDLSRIGNGLPTIVQIHDPQCSQCATLQRATRRAMDRFDADDFQYLVANIRSTDGAAFAGAAGLPHVTLLLLDGDGTRQRVIQGITPQDQIAAALVRDLGLREAR